MFSLKNNNNNNDDDDDDDDKATTRLPMEHFLKTKWQFSPGPWLPMLVKAGSFMKVYSQRIHYQRKIYRRQCKRNETITICS